MVEVKKIKSNEYVNEEKCIVLLKREFVVEVKIRLFYVSKNTRENRKVTGMYKV